MPGGLCGQLAADLGALGSFRGADLHRQTILEIPAYLA